MTDASQLQIYINIQSKNNLNKYILTEESRKLPNPDFNHQWLFWKLHRPLSQTKNIRYWRKHALGLLLAGSRMCCVLCNQAMYTTVSLDFWVWNERIQCNQQVLMNLGICYVSCFFCRNSLYFFKTVVWTSDRFTEKNHYFGTRNVQTQSEYQPQAHREKLPAKLRRPRRVTPVRCGM